MLANLGMLTVLVGPDALAGWLHNLDAFEEPGQDPLEALATFLEEWSVLLLVVDNLEHLLPAAADFDALLGESGTHGPGVGSQAWSKPWRCGRAAGIHGGLQRRQLAGTIGVA